MGPASKLNQAYPAGFYYCVHVLFKVGFFRSLAQLVNGINIDNK